MHPLQSVLLRLKKVNEAVTVHDFISTGLKSFDFVLNGGFQKGKVYLLAGEESVGKTALLVHVAQEVGLQNEMKTKVGILTLDHSPESLFERMVSRHTGIFLEKIMRGELSESEFKSVRDECVATELQSFLVNEDFCPSLPSLISYCLKWCSLGAEVIFIDSINSLSRSIEESIEIGKSLQLLAATLQITIVVTVRVIKNKHEGLLRLSDLSEYSGLQQHADVILFLERPEFSDDLNDSEVFCRNQMFLRSMKNQNGKLNHAAIRADLQRQYFKDIVEPQTETK